MNPFCAASEEFTAAIQGIQSCQKSRFWTRHSPVKSGFLQTPENLRAELAAALQFYPNCLETENTLWLLGILDVGQILIEIQI